MDKQQFVVLFNRDNIDTVSCPTCDNWVSPDVGPVMFFRSQGRNYPMCDDCAEGYAPNLFKLIQAANLEIDGTAEEVWEHYQRLVKLQGIE